MIGSKGWPGTLKEVPTPKHVLIREYVRDLIEEQTPGSRAPSESALMERFGVARMTVRQAVNALVNEGLLERVPGRGTFVSEEKLQMLAHLTSFTVEMRQRGMDPSAKTLLAQPKEAGAGVAAALDIESGRTVVHWRRLRFAGGQPMCIEDAYFLEKLIPGFLDRELPISLYAELGRHEWLPTRGEDSVEAAMPDVSEAALLNLDSNIPVLKVARRAYAGERPVVVSRSIYRADRYVLLRPLSRA